MAHPGKTILCNQQKNAEVYLRVGVERTPRSRVKQDKREQCVKQHYLPKRSHSSSLFFSLSQPPLPSSPLPLCLYLCRFISPECLYRLAPEAGKRNLEQWLPQGKGSRRLVYFLGGRGQGWPPLRGMWDPSYPTRHRTCIHCIGSTES